MEIEKMPEVLVNHIYSFIPIHILSLTCKKHWETNYKNIETRSYNSYCRYLLRNDMSYIFNHYFRLNYVLIIKKRKVSYKNKFFDSYYEMIKYLSLHEYNAQRCLKTMNNYIKNNSIHKKKYKKMKTRLTKWSN